MNIYQIDTPALIIDQDVFYRNIYRMNEILKQGDVKFMPHYKAHKSLEIARIQLNEGASGITCATVGEAEDLVSDGFDNILIANQVIDDSKISRLMRIAGSARITVCVDNEENIKRLSEAARFSNRTLYLYVEYDVGMGRCGVLKEKEVLKLARYIKGRDNLIFQGIQSYAGNNSHEVDFDKRKDEVEKTETKLRSLLHRLIAAGIDVKEVSGASTGTVEQKVKGGVYTEIQAGSYLFMDASYARLATGFENSMYVLATVLSSREGTIVTDCGMKSISTDQQLPHIKDLQNAKYKFSEEHGTIWSDIKKNIGERVLYIPGHSCTTVNLYNNAYFIKGDKIIRKIKIDSRGRSS